MNRDRTKELENVEWELYEEIPWPECLIGEKAWYYDSATGVTTEYVIGGPNEEEANDGQA